MARSVTRSSGPIVTKPRFSLSWPPRPNPNEVKKSIDSTKLRLDCFITMKTRWQKEAIFGSAAAARQSNSWPVVRSDNCRVDIAELVKLRRAEKADRYASALKPVTKHLRHRNCRQGCLAEFSIANRER